MLPGIILEFYRTAAVCAKHVMFSRGSACMQVLDMLQSADAVGPTLPLVCTQHPETTTNIRSAEDFDLFVKDGGCSLPCMTTLACGHACPRSALVAHVLSSLHI